MRELLLENNPDAVIIGEECDILATHAVDMWMSWRISSPAEAPHIAMTRYSIPDTMLSWVVDSDPARAAWAFAMGMYLCLMVHGGEGTLEDEPELARLVGALAALRRTTADRTVLARFNDTRGFEVDSAEGLVAHSFDSPDGPAVIVAAPGAHAGGRLRVDRSAFAAPGDPQGGVLPWLAGSSQPGTGDSQEFSLSANEVAVWVL